LIQRSLVRGPSGQVAQEGHDLFLVDVHVQTEEKPALFGIRLVLFLLFDDQPGGEQFAAEVPFVQFDDFFREHFALVDRGVVQNNNGLFRDDPREIVQKIDYRLGVPRSFAGSLKKF